MSVNHSTRSGGIIGISFQFSNVMVCCVFSLELPHFQYKKEIHPKLSQICSYGIFSKGLKNKVKTAVINEPSVSEPLKSTVLIVLFGNKKGIFSLQNNPKNI